MLRALVIKELRETAGIVVLALIAWVLVVYGVSGPVFGIWQLADYGRFPFVNDAFITRFTLIMGALAIALGLRQSAREATKDTYQFLLHRPCGIRFIFGAKLLVGGGLVLLFGGLAVFAYALWAATPGNSPTPFFWSMTTTAFVLALCMLLVYLGAFLSGLRPARWFGTRLAPLVGVIGITWMVGSWTWWIAVAGLVLVAALSVLSIFYCAEARDY